MTLAEFILARIAEDEREANVMMRQYREGGDVSSRRWRRVLAECAAIRAVVALHPPTTAGGLCETCGSLDGPYAFDDPENLVSYPCPTLRSLATIWSDHEDYRPEEWA